MSTLLLIVLGTLLLSGASVAYYHFMYKKRTRNTDREYLKEKYTIRTVQKTSVIEQGVTFNKEKYETFGVKSAESSHSHSQAIATSLDRVFDMVRDDQKIDEERVKNKIQSLEAEHRESTNSKAEEIADLAKNEEAENNKKDEIKKLEDSINSVDDDTDKIKEEIKQLHVEIEGIYVEIDNIIEIEGETKGKRKIKRREEEIKRLKEEIKLKEKDLPQHRSTGDWLAFILSGAIVLLLTAFLIFFYTMTFRASGFVQMLAELINAHALTFVDIGTMSNIINICIFIVPVALGIALVYFLMQKKHSLTAFVVVISVLLDTVLGYRVSRAVHIQEQVGKDAQIEWERLMVLQDTHFYLMVLLGFIAYVLWGFLVYYCLDHPIVKKNSDEKGKKIQAIKKQIEVCKEELCGIEKLIGLNKKYIAILEANIKSIDEEISRYKTGIEQISEAFLRGSIGEFMIGWNKFTNGKFPPLEAKELITIADKSQASWLNDKINNLKNISLVG